MERQNRYPFDNSQRDQQRPPPPVGSMNPTDLNEALLFQRRQQEQLQRDLQLRQMLLQGQRQQNMHQQRIFELQQQYAGQSAQQALASLQHDEQVLQEQITRRRQLQQQIQNNRMAPLTSIVGSPIQRSINTEALVADTLSANATRRSTGNRRKRSTSDNDEKADGNKRARKDSISKHQSDAMLLAEASWQNREDESVMHSKPKAKKKSRKSTISPEIAHHGTHEAQAIEGFQELLNAQERVPVQVYETPYQSATVEMVHTKGTIESLLEAGKAEQQVDDAATVMVTLQDVTELSDSELDESGIGSGADDGVNVVKIDLPDFKSKLPRLPIEPVFDVSPVKSSPEKKSVDESKVDEMDRDTTGVNEDKAVTVSELENGSVTEQAIEAKENGAQVAQAEAIQPFDYPYAVDTWWPSIPTIRRERRTNGEETDQDNFVEEPGLYQDESSFRADTRTIRSRLENDVQPGMLEKIPHCKIHRLRTRAQKGANIPDHAFCWQVTETYCNDVMVCCSICSTWRHAGCGGHYKPYSIRESIESKEPFEAVCDLCHEERALLQDYPRGEARLERQRIEQLRRALATSAVIRQAPFVKYGGTYKWPLGSVSGTHIGGHIRSAHSRHDKAEKTWSDMTSRLGRENRPKERVKTRTREFEKLLVCLEDAEGLMERHNMIQFLENDTRKKAPAGYEKQLRNLFDPDDDEHPANGDDLVTAPSQETQGEEIPLRSIGRKPPVRRHTNGYGSKSEEAVCARIGCCKKPRFDSLFCSDSCGVSELERDLLRALYIAGELHPSMMRTS